MILTTSEAVKRNETSETLKRSLERAAYLLLGGEIVRVPLQILKCLQLLLAQRRHFLRGAGTGVGGRRGLWVPGGHLR